MPQYGVQTAADPKYGTQLLWLMRRSFCAENMLRPRSLMHALPLRTRSRVSFHRDLNLTAPYAATT